MKTKYRLTVFGVKDTTASIVTYIHENICPVDLVVTIHPSVLKGNQVSGYLGLGFLTRQYGIPVYEAKSYALKDEETACFFQENEFELGISMGWQRLIPQSVLDSFPEGIYGFHGSCGYLPYGRGRSPLNWSVINGDTRFVLNLFRYDAEADSPNVFANEMFAITPHDTIRTLQYKNILASRQLIARLIAAWQSGTIRVNRLSRDFNSWYAKRTAEDGKIDFHAKTREIYNLIRGVTRPFPGAFACLDVCDGVSEGTACAGEEKTEERVTIWTAHPFDEMMDFSAYAPGEIIDVMDGKLIVRTVDGSLLVEEYECRIPPKAGDRLY